MIETIFELIGLNLTDYNIDHNLLFVIGSLVLLYCLGYVFNFFQVLMERLTARKGR